MKDVTKYFLESNKFTEKKKKRESNTIIVAYM